MIYRNWPHLRMARGDPALIFGARGDPGLFQHTRDHSLKDHLILNTLTGYYYRYGDGMPQFNCQSLKSGIIKKFLE